MEELSATEAARRFSELLDAIEHGQGSFVITRHGRPVARMAPAGGSSGRALRDFLRDHRPDPRWALELGGLRDLIVTEEQRWQG